MTAARRALAVLPVAAAAIAASSARGRRGEDAARAFRTSPASRRCRSSPPASPRATSVTVYTTTAANPAPRLLTSSQLDGLGAFQTATLPPPFTKSNGNLETFKLIAADKTNPAAPIVATTPFQVVRFGLTRTPTPKRPTSRVTYTARGFTPGKPVYAHFRFGGVTRRTVSLGIAKGAVRDRVQADARAADEGPLRRVARVHRPVQEVLAGDAAAVEGPVHDHARPGLSGPLRSGDQRRAQREERHDERRERHDADLAAHDRQHDRALLVPRAARRPPGRRAARGSRAPARPRRSAAARRSARSRPAAARRASTARRRARSRRRTARRRRAPARPRRPARRAAAARRARSGCTCHQRQPAKAPADRVDREHGPCGDLGDRPLIHGVSRAVGT